MFEGNPTREASPSYSNNKLIPFRLVPSGHFPQAVSEQVSQPLLGLHSFAWFFLASYFLHQVLYHNILSEPATTVFLKTDLV